MNTKEDKINVPRLTPDGKRNPDYAKVVRQRMIERVGLEEFNRREKEKNQKWRTKNPEKYPNYSKKYRDKFPERYKAHSKKARLKKAESDPTYYYRNQRRSAFKNRYGITIEDYYVMLEEQNNKCLICNTEHFEESRKRLHVDHCHKTGKVRGLLCNDCNNLLGRAQDDINVLEKAIEYIKRYEQ